MSAANTMGPLHIVGVGDMKVSADVGETLITYALGSCLGVTIYDPVIRVGGMLHVMLPDSRIDPAKALLNPFKFVDKGVPMLFRAAYALGGKKERMILKVAGGASVLDGQREFRIGERNIAMLRKILWKNNVPVDAEDVGDCISRTMSLEIASGGVHIRANGQTYAL